MSESKEYREAKAAFEKQNEGKITKHQIKKLRDLGYSIDQYFYDDKWHVTKAGAKNLIESLKDKK